jgi:predicted GIY-YIG superfamily endonuclease
MGISQADFLVLNLQGIDLFLEKVDQACQSGFCGGDFHAAALEVSKQIHDYSRQRGALASAPKVGVHPAPFTMRLGDLLRRETCNLPEFAGVGLNVVYIVRAGDDVLYVGSTRYNARSRMKSHQKQHSPLGQALREDPNAMNWGVEMIPHSDYREAARKERELITQLQPRFCRREF